MSKTANKPEIKKREIGERVDVLASFDPATVKNLGDGIFEATITTSHKDRTGENIVTEGVDPNSWEQTGMPVLYGHDYQGLPIGKGLSWKSFKNKMTSRFQLAIAEYPFAATVAKMIEGGYLNAVSIGGRVLEWSEDYMTIVKMEMVEFSVVPIPANPNALITSRALEEATGKSIDKIKSEYQEFNKSVLLDKVKDLDENEARDAIKALKILLARLEESIDLTGDETTKTKNYKIIYKDSKAVVEQSQKLVKIIKIGIRK